MLRLATSVLALLAPTGALAAPVSWSGKVVGVADGDTVTVLHGQTPVKIRLHGIDAPEKAQPFGEKAKQLTSSLVFGKEVRVEVVTKDRYGRTVARVHVDARCLNEELLKAGLAWWYRQYSPRDKKLAALEDEARKARRGLWAEASPTPPWSWRRAGCAGGRCAQRQPRPVAPRGLYRGSVRSKVFHAPGCPDYACRSCTVGFRTLDEAKNASYRPHAACVRLFLAP